MEWFIGFLVIGLAISLPGVAMAGKLQQQLTKESTLDQIMRRGAMRVGMDTFVPWAMKDKTGKFVGFEIDVAKQLAEDMGVKVEFVPTKWAGIIPALLTGKFDVVIGGMGIRPKRALKVNFTIPYDYSGMSMVAHKKLAAGFDFYLLLFRQRSNHAVAGSGRIRSCTFRNNPAHPKLFFHHA